MTSSKLSPVDALRANRREDSIAKQRQAQAALDELVARCAPISVAAVAREARLHRSFIYSHPHLRQQVEQAMHMSRRDATPGQRRPNTSDAAEPGLRAELLIAHDQIRQLRHANRQLRTKLDHYLGAALDTADIAKFEQELARKTREVDRLTSENHILTVRLRDLQHELADVGEDLAAERRAAMRSQPLAGSNQRDLSGRNGPSSTSTPTSGSTVGRSYTLRPHNPTEVHQ
jgi:Family of unknown function (DUF6262)